MSSTASGWDWIRRSAVSPREFTWSKRPDTMSRATGFKTLGSIRTEVSFFTETLPNYQYERQSDLITKSSKISLKAFMFTLQSLDTGQIMTIIVCVEGLVLLFNPLFGFISIPDKKYLYIYKSCFIVLFIRYNAPYKLLVTVTQIFFLPISGLYDHIHIQNCTCGSAALHGHFPTYCSSLQPTAAGTSNGYSAPAHVI